MTPEVDAVLDQVRVQLRNLLLGDLHLLERRADLLVGEVAPLAAQGDQADELLDEWPDQFLEHARVDARTAICMMTHDLKFDVPALKLALTSDAGFIGAMGSEKTRADRDARLREGGIGDADLARLHAPIGIQIGAESTQASFGDAWSVQAL